MPHAWPIRRCVAGATSPQRFGARIRHSVRSGFVAAPHRVAPNPPGSRLTATTPAFARCGEVRRSLGRGDSKP